MAKRTEHYRLRMPEPTDAVNVTADISENMSKIDKILYEDKQDALDEDQINATKSGITSDKVEAFQSHVDDAEGMHSPHVSDDERERWNEAAKGAMYVEGSGIKIVDVDDENMLDQKAISHENIIEPGMVGTGDNKFLKIKYDKNGHIVTVEEKDMVTFKGTVNPVEGVPLDSTVGAYLQTEINNIGPTTLKFKDKFKIQIGTSLLFHAAFYIDETLYSIHNDDPAGDWYVVDHSTEEHIPITYDGDIGYFVLKGIYYVTNYRGRDEDNDIWFDDDKQKLDVQFDGKPAALTQYAVNRHREYPFQTTMIMLKSNKHEYYFDTVQNKWVDKGASDETEIFTDDTLGYILGRQEDGYVESADNEGHGKVHGWENLATESELEAEKTARTNADTELKNTKQDNLTSENAGNNVTITTNPDTGKVKINAKDAVEDVKLDGASLVTDKIANLTGKFMKRTTDLPSGKTSMASNEVGDAGACMTLIEDGNNVAGVAVNDGAVLAQIYAMSIPATKTGMRINVEAGGIYYTKGRADAAHIPSDEIARILDINNERDAREAADTTLQDAIDTKQDKLVAGANIIIAADGKTISTAPLVKIEIVSALPATGEANIFYFLPQAGATNRYDEYIYVEGDTVPWKLIGSTEIDLSNYYTKTESDGLYYNKTYIGTNYYTKTESDGLYYNKTFFDNKYDELIATITALTARVATLETKVTELESNRIIGDSE